MARNNELSLASNSHQDRGLVSASLAANYRGHDFRNYSFHDLRHDHRRDPGGEDGDWYAQREAEPMTLSEF